MEPHPALDDRWRAELEPDLEETFERLAGDRNRACPAAAATKAAGRADGAALARETSAGP